MLNIYFLITPKPHKVSKPISRGYYVTQNINGIFYRLSITDDNEVYLYGPGDAIKGDLLYVGKIELDKNKNCYLITTNSNEYQVVGHDDIIYLPIIKNKKIIIQKFEKINDAPVIYDY